MYRKQNYFPIHVIYQLQTNSKTMSMSRLPKYKVIHCICIVFLTNISTVTASGTFPAQISQPGRLVQTFLRQPVDQTAKQGDHVTLPCQVDTKRGMLQWTRDGFGLGVERNLTGFDRYHMTGSNEEGMYDSVTISV